MSQALGNLPIIQPLGERHWTLTLDKLMPWNYMPVP
jgi:hypothetical protein